MQEPSVFTQIRVSIVEKDNLRAIVSVKVADAIYLTGLRIIEGKNGLFVSMPSKKDKAGEYHDVYFAASKMRRDELQGLILEAYRKELGTAEAAR